MLKLGSDQRRKWLYLCGSHRIYWHLWEFSSVSNQILTLRWIQTKNSKNISWSFPSWHRPPVRLSSSGHFTYLFFFAYFSRVFSVIGTLSTELPKKKQNKHLQFLHQICPKNKKTNQTFTLSARIWTQRCDSDFAQGCKISLESLGGVHVSLTVWPSPTQRPVDALIINCIAKNNPTTRLSSSGGGWSLLGNMHTQSESLPPPHRLQSHITAASLSVQKQKGEQITTVELRRSCSRSTEHRATPREDFRSRHLFIFTSAGGERRETTPSYEHVDQSGGSFSYKNGKTNQLVAGNNSTQTILVFKRFLNTTVSEVRFLISRRESHVIS